MHKTRPKCTSRVALVATGLGQYDPTIYIKEMLNMESLYIAQIFCHILVDLRYEHVLQSVQVYVTIVYRPLL